MLGFATLLLLVTSAFVYLRWRVGQIERVELAHVLAPASPSGPTWLLVGSDSREGIDPDRPDAGGLIGEEIRRINAGLPDAARVKKFLLLNKDFDADDDEVTRTRKIRRAFVTEKYAPVVDAFYGGSQEVDMKIDVTFEDGSKSQIDSHLIVEDAA